MQSNKIITCYISNPIERLYLYIQNNLSFFLILIFIIWFNNFLLSPLFGLYNDDWTAIGGNFKYELFSGVDGPFGWFKSWPHGRPLGWFFTSVLSIPGKLIENIFIHYLVGFAIIVIISILFYAIVKYKYNKTVAILATLFFILSPANTTHTHLTMIFIAYPGIIFSILGIYLYQKKKYLLAYIIATLALITYESTYFLYIGAPLFAYSINKIGTWRKIIIHGIICSALVVFVHVIRVTLFDYDINIHNTLRDHSSFYYFLNGLISYFLHFFKLIYFSLSQGAMNIGLLGAVVGLSTLAMVIFAMEKTETTSNTLFFFDLLLVGLVLLILGILTSGLTTIYPFKAFGGRATRVYTSAFIGGGLIFSSITLMLYQCKRYAYVKVIGSIFIALFILFGSSKAIKTQQEYAEAWKLQRKTINAVISLSCDLEPGDILVVEPKEPKWDKGRAIYPHSFGYATAFADIFTWGDVATLQKPRMFKAHKQWTDQITVDNDGLVRFKKQVFAGIPRIANLPVKAGHIIHIIEKKDKFIRSNEPIIVNNIDIIKHIPNKDEPKECFSIRNPATGILKEVIY